MPFGFSHEVKSAWLAAALDGEGCITTYCRKDKGPNGVLSVAINIVNTNLDFVERFKEFAKVRYKITKYSQNNENWNPQYYMCIGKQKDVLRILKEIEPFLIIKRAKALLVIEWLSLRVIKQTR